MAANPLDDKLMANEKQLWEQFKTKMQKVSAQVLPKIVWKWQATDGDE